MRSRRLLMEALKSGTVGAFAMPIAGTLTKPFFGWHVWQYGKKSAQLITENVTPAAMFAQHMLWSWVSALLLIGLLLRTPRGTPVLIGGAVGVAYYFLVNATMLPLYFGDPFPWQQSISHVVQPLVVLVAFAMCVAFVSSRYIAAARSGT